MERSCFIQWLQDAQRKKPKLVKDKPRFARVALASRVVTSYLKEERDQARVWVYSPWRYSMSRWRSCHLAGHAGWRFWYWWGNWPNFLGSSAIPVPSLAICPALLPREGSWLCKSWRRMLHRYEHLVPWTSLTRELGVQRFPEESGESEQGRILNSSNPGGWSFWGGLLLGLLSVRHALSPIRLWLFHQLYSHWIPRSSQLTFHKRSAVLLSRDFGDTQAFLQSLEGRERA